ncbi:MAG: hypothetical protein WA790_01965 [Sulfitobacter sp.]
MTNLETSETLRSAHVLGQALLLIFGVLLASIVMLVVWMAVDLPQIGQILAANVGYGDDALRVWQGIALGAVLLVQMGIWAAAVWRGRKIFTALGAGELNDASTAAAMTARLLWIMLIWGILAHILGTVIATWHFAEGTRALGIALGVNQISTTFAALLATFASRAFVLGAALWQDHREVI